jgi:hypothetical protein
MARNPSDYCGDADSRQTSVRIAGFIRTCAKDIEFLIFALRSICKFAFPLLSSVTVVFAEHEAEKLVPLLSGAFPWVIARPVDTEKRIASRFRAQTGKDININAPGKSFLTPGVGYHAAMIDKLHADVHVPAGHNFVMFCDSDNLFTRRLRLSDLFSVEGHASLPPHHHEGRNQAFHKLRVLTDPYQQGTMHESAWRRVTARLLNLSVARTSLTFMTRVGGLTFPTWIYPPLRAHLYSVLNASLGAEDLYAYAAALLHPELSPVHGKQRHFIDFELMGASMYYLYAHRLKAHARSPRAPHPLAMHRTKRACAPMSVSRVCHVCAVC